METQYTWRVNLYELIHQHYVIVVHTNHNVHSELLVVGNVIAIHSLSLNQWQLSKVDFPNKQVGILHIRSYLFISAHLVRYQ